MPRQQPPNMCNGHKAVITLCPLHLHSHNTKKNILRSTRKVFTSKMLSLPQTNQKKRSTICMRNSRHYLKQSPPVLYSKNLSQYTHTRAFNSPLSRTTQVSQYQKGKTNLDFTEARDSECQWHQLGQMQVCTSLQTDNHASTPPGHHSVFYGPDALPAAQPTALKHWRASSYR